MQQGETGESAPAMIKAVIWTGANDTLQNFCVGAALKNYYRTRQDTAWLARHCLRANGSSTVSIFDLFSKRQKKLRGEVPDVYTYSDLPKELRTQIVHIWFDALGSRDDFFQQTVQSAYEFIVNTLCREYGQFCLHETRQQGGRHCQQELVLFFLAEDDVERALDAVEISFKVIDTKTRHWDYLRRNNSSIIADSAIVELNARFQEHGVGFQYTDGEIVRVDSALLHAEVVKPALRLLNGKQYAGAQQEFLKAHEHYRHGNAKEALNECLKSFESMMKAICDKRGWSFAKTATARDLIQVCFDKGLVPAFWQQNYSSLRSLLESSVPTGRNKLSGHGQGSSPVAVPPYLVSYTLHMTAAVIVFLGDAEASMP